MATKTKKQISVSCVTRAQAGDPAAMEELFAAMKDLCYFYALKLLHNPQQAEDAVQETAIRVFTNIGKLKDPKLFTAWALRICNNCCLQDLRRQKKATFVDAVDEEGNDWEFEDEDRSARPDEALDTRQTQSIIAEIVDSLPQEQRLCTYMYYFEELSVAEISTALGVSENTMKSRLYYSRGKIRQEVENYEREGIKLYSGAAVIPFALIAAALHNAAEGVVLPAEAGAAILQGAAAAASQGVSAASAAADAAAAAEAASSAAAAGGAAGTAAAAATAAATTAASATAGAATAAVGTSLLVKIGAGLAAAAMLAAGGLAIGNRLEAEEEWMHETRWEDSVLAEWQPAEEQDLEYMRPWREISGVWTPEGAAFSLQYVINSDDTVSIVGVEGEFTGEVDIPAEIEGRQVVGITYGAFHAGVAEITHLTLPDGLLAIAPNAFMTYVHQSEVLLPASLRSIGPRAFNRNGIQNFVVAEGNAHFQTVDGILYTADGTVLCLGPGGRTEPVSALPSVKTVWEFAFHRAEKIPSVVLPEGVESVGDYAFSGLSCIVDVPDTLQSIGRHAFVYNYTAVSQSGEGIERSVRATLRGNAGCYAEGYAAERELTFLTRNALVPFEARYYSARDLFSNHMGEQIGHSGRFTFCYLWLHRNGSFSLHFNVYSLAARVTGQYTVEEGQTVLLSGNYLGGAGQPATFRFRLGEDNVMEYVETSDANAAVTLRIHNRLVAAQDCYPQFWRRGEAEMCLLTLEKPQAGYDMQPLAEDAPVYIAQGEPTS